MVSSSLDRTQTSSISASFVGGRSYANVSPIVDTDTRISLRMNAIFRSFTYVIDTLKYLSTNGAIMATILMATIMATISDRKKYSSI